MDAVDALNEIAFWLERELAPTFKVQAFRKAAGDHRAASSRTNWRRGSRDGRLKRMKGIGDRTFEVIAQAVDGEVPDYLADLRERGAAAAGRRRRASCCASSARRPAQPQRLVRRRVADRG